jgi:acetyl-CoA carboxylase biotin carboxylase subunit
VPDGPYVRNDAGCYEGAEIPVFYDPMISKLVVWGEDRAAACARMRRALDEYQVRGIETNLPFHRRCVRHPSFLEGEYDTGFIGREHARLTPQPGDGDVTAAAIALALEATMPSARKSAANGASNGAAKPSHAPPPSAEPSAWRTIGRGWR